MDMNCICLHGTWHEIRLSRKFHVVCIVHVTWEHTVALALNMKRDIAFYWVGVHGYGHQSSLLMNG